MSRNRALEAFLAEVGSEFVLAQVLILRQRRGCELRHVDDRAISADKLRLLPIPELRALAQFTATHAFRPLKAAPNLQTGWRAVASNADELGRALQHLYPNAV